MAAKEYQNGMVPMPVCEICWILDHTRWEPESIGEDGNVLVKLVGIDTPDIISSGSTDVCSICGGITIAGIYELKEEANLSYKDDEEYDSYDEYIPDPTHYIFSLNSEEDASEESDE